MARKAEIYKRYQNDIFTCFTLMNETVENGVHKYSTEYVLKTLELLFYTDAQNIMRIVKIKLREQDDPLQKETINSSNKIVLLNLKNYINGKQ